VPDAYDEIVPGNYRSGGRATALLAAWTAIIICAAAAWYAGGGVLGVVAVAVVGALIVMYRRANPLRNWQTGRPWRDSARRPAAGPGRAASSDPVEDWIRERSLCDRFDDRHEGGEDSASRDRR
jgi:hypothetical protein